MTHRVGTVTLGVTMIATGVLYLLNLFWNVLDYLWIWKLWPVIFILLGVEILLANVKQCGQFVYDKAGILLTFILVSFAFCMAVIQKAVEAGCLRFS